MPTATLKCPPAERLARYVLGQLPAADSELVREHMAECDVCAGKFGDQNKMESDPVGLTAATGVVALHRTSFETPPVKQVATPLPARSPGLRQGPLPVDVPGDPIKVFSSPDFSNINEYRFLRPATQPGDLGQLGPYRILKLASM